MIGNAAFDRIRARQPHQPHVALVDGVLEHLRRPAIHGGVFALSTAMPMLAVCVSSIDSKYFRKPWLSTIATAMRQLCLRDSSIAAAAIFLA